MLLNTFNLILVTYLYMHDLHAADRIHRLVIEQAAQNNFKKVFRIEINLGTVIEHGASISRDNLEFNLKMLNAKTVADGAVVIINEVAGDDWELISIEGE